MKHNGFLLAVAALTPVVCQAQLILHNAKFYTMDSVNPEALGVAIDSQGFIEELGDMATLSAAYPSYDLMDLGGQLVLPGFHDVHLHAVEAGVNALLCYLEPDTYVEDIPAFLKACPDGGKFGGAGWIMGAGIDLSELMFVQNSDPSIPYPLDVLDQAFPDTPVVILDALGHGAICNSMALQAVGYDSLTADPPGGAVLQDAEGNPLGIATENAQQLLRDAAFPNTPENQAIAKASLLDALSILNKNGITSVSDAGGFWRQAQTEAWSQVLADNSLTVRASNALYVYPDEDMSTQIVELEQRYSNDPDSLLRFNQAKIYVDGILSLQTGKLFEPYVYDDFEEFHMTPQNKLGREYFGGNLNAVAQSCVDSGFQLHFHATGDKGANLALEAIRALTNSDATVEPHRLTHCYLVDAADHPSFAELGVIADFQLAPSSVSQENVDFMADVLGATRSATLLPALEIYNAGATLTLSSDWDADDLSPIAKVQTVLTRPDGRNFADAAEVLPMMTLNAAQLLQQDDKTGSIQVGKFADLVVIDKDILTMAVDQINTAQVTMTFLQGEIVYDKASDPGRSEEEPFADAAEEVESAAGLETMMRPSLIVLLASVTLYAFLI